MRAVALALLYDAVTQIQDTGACLCRHRAESQDLFLLSVGLFMAAHPTALRGTKVFTVTSAVCLGSYIRVVTTDMAAPTATKERRSKAAAQTALPLTRESRATSATDRGRCTCVVTIAPMARIAVRVIAVLLRTFRKPPRNSMRADVPVELRQLLRGLLEGPLSSLGDESEPSEGGGLPGHLLQVRLISHLYV
jgi:hypothetical protein